MRGRDAGPPRLAGWLLERLRPGDAEPILGDLEEEYRLRVRPYRGRAASNRWYWRMVLGSLIRWSPRNEMPRSAANGRRGRLAMDLNRDVRLALRGMVRQPAHAAAVVLTLALGIGANAAVFNLVDSVLLRPLPHPAADRLVLVREVSADGWQNWPSWLNFVDWRAEATSFELLAASTWPSESTVLGGSEAVRRTGIAVSQDFWALTGARPLTGRLPAAEEHAAGTRRVVVVSERLWQQVLGARHDLGGISLRIDSEVFEVVGVLPSSFSVLDERVDLWVPLEPYGANFAARGAHMLRVLGRIRSGVTFAAANEELAGISKRIGEHYGPSVTDMVSANLAPLRDWVVGPAKRPLLMLLGAAALVLLLTCANVAGIGLARMTARIREFAVRSSLGAGRARLVRQLMVESTLLAVIGGAIGLAGWAALTRVLQANSLLAVPRAGAVGVDLRVIIATVLIALLAAALSALAPALRVSGSSLERLLRSGGRAVVTGRSAALRWLVAVQVGLALLLLVGSGLLIRSLVNVLTSDVGYDAENVIIAQISVPGTRYPNDPAMVDYMSNALTRLSAVPGVTQVGLTSKLPIEAWDYTGPIVLENGESTTGQNAGYRVVSGGYFASLGIPLIRGRVFDANTDRRDAPQVVIINETLARRFWPDENPIGRRFQARGMDPYGEWLTIIGVVGEARHWRMPEGQQAEYYVPFSQRPVAARNSQITIRVAGGLAGTVGQIRETFVRLDPEVPADLVMLNAMLGGTVRLNRFIMAVLTVFATLALVLAMVGVYGVVSNAVAQRTREIGVRLALGARPARVQALVQEGALRMVGLGLLLGIAGALMLTRLLESLLFGVQPNDALVLFGAAAVLAIAALLASWVPARRALRIDPMQAMRDD